MRNDRAEAIVRYSNDVHRYNEAMTKWREHVGESVPNPTWEHVATLAEALQVIEGTAVVLHPPATFWDVDKRGKVSWVAGVTFNAPGYTLDPYQFSETVRFTARHPRHLVSKLYGALRQRAQTHRPLAPDPEHYYYVEEHPFRKGRMMVKSLCAADVAREPRPL